MSQALTIGAIVHFYGPDEGDPWSYSEEPDGPYAAIVTDTTSGVDLCVFKPTGLVFLWDVREAEPGEPKPRTWMWPPEEKP